jgi:hypothetical protein
VWSGGLLLVTALMSVAAKRVSAPSAEAEAEAGMRLWLLEGATSQHVSSSGTEGVLLNVNTQYFETERGLGATKALRRGDVAVWVPGRFSLNTRTSSIPAQVLNRFVPHPELGLRTVQLAATLLYEASLGNASKFYQHIQSFPEHTPRNSATWSSSQKALFSSVTGMQGSDCDVHLPVFVQNLLRVADDSPAQLAVELQLPLEQWSTWTSTELQRRTQWACAMAISRNFGGSLYPMLDMANHNTRAVWGEDTISIDFSPSCVPQLLQCLPRPSVLSRSTGRTVRALRCVESVRKSCTSSDAAGNLGHGIVALRDFKAGEQVFDNYGHQSNLKLLFQWGFVDELNVAGTDAIFDWRSVSHIWEDNDQLEWMSQSNITGVAHCVKMFNRLTLIQAGSSTLPNLRLNLNQTAAPHGFDAPSIDCIRLLVQNFTSESAFKEVIARGSLYQWPLPSTEAGTEGAVLGVEGKTISGELPGCVDAPDGPRSQVDRKVLQMVAATCSEIADRFAAGQTSPTHASVHEQVLQDAEQLGASFQTSQQIIRWIQMELHAANACTRKITEWLREGNHAETHERCLASNTSELVTHGQ